MSRKSRAASAQKFEKPFENTIQFDRSPFIKPNQRSFDIVPKTLTQEKYLFALQDETKDIVVAHGPAGTGKTYLAMLLAIKALRTGQCSRLVLTRPMVGVEEEEMGALPGTLLEKMAPWTRPLFDVLAEYYNKKEITTLLENEIIEIAPLMFMRGRTLKDTWIIADEMQNSTNNQIKMLLTRIGSGSKLVITGDLEQRDRRFKTDNGLSDFVQRLEQSYSGTRIASIAYSPRDVQRHPIISEILSLFECDLK